MTTPKSNRLSVRLPLVGENTYLEVFNAPRPKPRSGLSAERQREQQRWAWKAAAQHRTKQGGAATDEGESVLDSSGQASSVTLGDADHGGKRSMAKRLSRFFRTPLGNDEAHQEELDDEEDNDDEEALPNPADRAVFDAYTEKITARECIAVVARRAELTKACAHLEVSLAGDLSEEARLENQRRLEVVRKMLADFNRRWQFTPTGCCGLTRAVRRCTYGDETDEERLERIVRAKVRRDVKIAFVWDCELSELELEAKERYLMELARFEHLSYAEQKIYTQIGGMALEVGGLGHYRSSLLHFP